MRSRTVLAALWVSSLWMTDGPDPRRAGQSEASLTHCKAPGCGLRLHSSGPDWVCSNRHVWRRDDTKGEYVQAKSDS